MEAVSTAAQPKPGMHSKAEMLYIAVQMSHMPKVLACPPCQQVMSNSTNPVQQECAHQRSITACMGGHEKGRKVPMTARRARQQPRNHCSCFISDTKPNSAVLQQTCAMHSQLTPSAANDAIIRCPSVISYEQQVRWMLPRKACITTKRPARSRERLVR